MKQPKAKFSEGDICLVKTKGTLELLPCMPAIRGDDALEIKNGVLLNCLGLLEVTMNSWFYKMEIVTGKEAGNTVYVWQSLEDCLEMVPSHRRVR